MQKLYKNEHGDNRAIYSLRHTYATLRLQNGANVYGLKKNMSASVAMIERHYGQTNVLMGIEHETAKRRKPREPGSKTTKGTTAKTKPTARKPPNSTSSQSRLTRSSLLAQWI